MPLNVQKVKWGHMIRATGAGAAGGVQIRGREGAKGAASDQVADEVFAAWVLGPAAKVPKVSTRPGLQAVLFDLDGVLVDTAEFHYRAWQRLADDLKIPFDRQMNHAFRGVGRMECLEKLLGEHARFFAGEEKGMLADKKNAYYLELVQTLSPKDVAAGARGLAMGLRGLSEGGVRLAVVSASRNARLVLQLLQIGDWFEALIDGADVTRGKPDPQGFLLAAERLRVRPRSCVVVEDADSGIQAARAAGMATVGIGPAAMEADVRMEAIGELTVERLEEMIPAR